jgi:hypothetical protein
MGFNEFTEHVGVSEMKTMMKYITAFCFISVAPFVTADEQATKSTEGSTLSKVQVAKKARQDNDGLPVRQLIMHAQTSQSSTVSHFNNVVEARTLHLPALTQLR